MTCRAHWAVASGRDPQDVVVVGEAALGLLYNSSVNASRASTKQLTRLVAVKDARDTDKINGHAELGVGLNVQRLLSRQSRREGCRCVLPA